MSNEQKEEIQKERSLSPKSQGMPFWIQLINFSRWTLVICIWTSIGLAGIFAYYAWDLPNLDEIQTRAKRPSITFLSAKGLPLATYGDHHSGAVRFNEVPPYLIQAIIATEDRRFFDHFGVDAIGIIRAALANLRAGGLRQGGSTLTQQLAKNLFLSPERTLRRKIQELILSFWLESNFTKRQIFTIYLNRVYLGAGNFGFGSAAKYYFGKPINKISLREASILTGLLKAPSRYSPNRSIHLALKRGNLVLLNMVKSGFLTSDEASIVKTKNIFLVNRLKGSGIRFFGDWLLKRIVGFVGQIDKDIIIKTTLSPGLQKLAERSVAEILMKEGVARDVGQAAMVVLSPHGSVRAMVGGNNYTVSKFNRATQAVRQAGSAFKIFVYLAALEAGLKPGDTLVDEPVSISGWSPKNYTGRFLGRLTLRQAFSFSVNTAAVKISEKVGRNKVVSAAQRLGITSNLKFHPSLALGASEVKLIDLTSAYAVFANNGFPSWPYGILEIRDKSNRLLYKRSGSKFSRLVKPSVVLDIQSMLQSAVQVGTGRKANISLSAAGKTGTSQDFRDAWFVGFSKNLVAGVWMGNDDSTPMKGVSGGNLPALLWGRFMRESLKKNL